MVDADRNPQQHHTEADESRALIRQALSLAHELGLRSILVQALDQRDVKWIDKVRGDQRLVWLVPPDKLDRFPQGANDVQVQMPGAIAARSVPVGVGMLQATLSGHIDLDETVLCLAGGVGGKRIDTLILTNPRRDFPWLGDPRLAESFREVVSQELARVLDIALRFASEGREGRAIGTLFVIGDPDELEPHLRQMILNPCHGHGARRCNIHEPNFVETLRELSALDGAFVVDRRGVVRQAGVYLDVQGTRVKLEDGLGARHRAAAAITSVTSSTAVVVSESSGRVTVFHAGSPILTLERG